MNETNGQGTQVADVEAIQAAVAGAAAPGAGVLNVIDLLGSAMAQRDQQIGMLSRRLKVTEELLEQAQALAGALQGELDALRRGEEPPAEPGGRQPDPELV